MKSQIKSVEIFESDSECPHRLLYYNHSGG